MAGYASLYDKSHELCGEAIYRSVFPLCIFASPIICLSIGVISDWGKNRFGVPRSYSLMLVSFLFFVSQLATAFIDDIKNLWIASTLLGFAYGSLWSLFVTVCLEWFGMRECRPLLVKNTHSDHDYIQAHFSENWGYLSMSPMVSGNLFSIIFGRNFDAHEGVQMEDIPSPSASLKLIRDSDSTTSADLRCFQGLECYVDTIYLTIGVTLLSILLSVWAGWRDKRRIRDGEAGPAKFLVT
jgi:hypothetical protein